MSERQQKQVTVGVKASAETGHCRCQHYILSLFHGHSLGVDRVFRRARVA